MAAHFVNNACLIVLACLHRDDTDALAPSTKLLLGTLGAVVLAARHPSHGACRQDAARYVAYFTDF